MGSVPLKSLSFPASGQWVTNLINMDVYTSRKSLSFPDLCRRTREDYTPMDLLATLSQQLSIYPGDLQQ